MTLQKLTWILPIAFTAAFLLGFAPIVVGCSPSCSDLDNCGPYVPPAGTSGDGGTAGNTGASTAGASGKSGTGGAGGTANDAGSGGQPDAGASGSTSKEPCDGACTATKPVCEETTDTCVECLDSHDCRGAKGACDTDTHACVDCLDSDDCADPNAVCDTATTHCVQCLTASDCKDPKAARCDAMACAQCETNQDCAHIAGKPVCDTTAGQCVQCTTDDDAAACGGKSCNPATKTCTTTAVETKDLCEPCLADSECIGGSQPDPDARCVPMTYDGTPRAGGFCLRRLSKTCERPFAIPTTQASLSGATSEDYCGINEQTTRCEAVLDLLRGRSCPTAMDTQCGCLRDPDNNCVTTGEAGLCRTVVAFANQCTYRCGADTQCPDGFTCSSTSPKYCK